VAVLGVSTLKHSADEAAVTGECTGVRGEQLGVQQRSVSALATVYCPVDLRQRDTGTSVRATQTPPLGAALRSHAHPRGTTDTALVANTPYSRECWRLTTSNHGIPDRDRRCD
jgi:hypothetical protein